MNVKPGVGSSPCGAAAVDDVGDGSDLRQLAFGELAQVGTVSDVVCQAYSCRRRMS